MKPGATRTLLLTTVLGGLCLVQFTLLVVFVAYTQPPSLLSVVPPILNRNQKLTTDNLPAPLRVACVIVYVGDTLPAWFDAFAASAEGAASLVDFFVFVTQAHPRDTPTNVKLVSLALPDLLNRIVRLNGDGVTDADLQEATGTLRQLVAKMPYALVEVKPALGTIFADYLRDYSHWAIADLDILVGRMHRLLTPDVLRHDIYSASFGDSYRFYLRGQLTIHRNDPYINALWKRCDHLARLRERLRAFADGGHEKWAFQSAEGCYSKAVVDSNATVLVSPAQLSDAYEAPTAQRETLRVGGALVSCHHAPLNVSAPAGLAHMAAMVAGTDPPPHALSGDWQNVRRVNWYRCAYWFPAQFEVCLDTLPARAAIVKGSDGALRYSDSDMHHALEHCREGLLTHFQGWKKNYYAFAVRPQPADAALVVVSDAGFIPLRVPALPARQSGARPYGRLTAGDTLIASSSSSTTSGGTSSALAPPGARSPATGYCLGFTADLKRCTCPLDGQHLRVLRVAGGGGPDAAGAVTLVTAAWAAAYAAGALDAQLDSWLGPKVIVIGTVDAHADTHTYATLARRRNDTTVVHVDLQPCQHAARGPFARRPGASVLPDNALFNVGLDVAATDLVCLSPPGLVFQADAAPVLRRQLRGSGARWGGLGGSLPVAIAVPAYVPRDVMTAAEAREEANDATLVAYPPRGALCGAEQSSRLRVPWGRDARAALDGDALAPVAFHAKAFLAEQALMLPVAFNVSAGPHGRGFVRLPEEANGEGCFGSLLLRVLAGSGFSLRWSDTHAVVHVHVHAHANVHDHTAPAAAGAGTGTGKGTGTGTGTGAGAGAGVAGGRGACGCSHVEDASAAEAFRAAVQAFYYRAIAVRDQGLATVYTPGPFGEIFEAEQAAKMEQGGAARGLRGR